MKYYLVVWFVVVWNRISCFYWKLNSIVCGKERREHDMMRSRAAKCLNGIFSFQILNFFLPSAIMAIAWDLFPVISFRRSCSFPFSLSGMSANIVSARVFSSSIFTSSTVRIASTNKSFNFLLSGSLSKPSVCSWSWNRLWHI